MGTISHDGEVRALARGKTVFDYADELAVRVATSCGRAGTCHECVVQVEAGMEALCGRTEAERFLKDPFRPRVSGDGGGSVHRRALRTGCGASRECSPPASPRRLGRMNRRRWIPR